MGRFNIRAIERKVALQKKEKQDRIKASLHLKPLLKVIPKGAKKSKIKDGVILFGKYTGQKVSALLNNQDTVAYVTDYLSKNKDLPYKFRDQIDTIIQNLDPWGDMVDTSQFSGMSVREVLDPDDDVPW